MVVARAGGEGPHQRGRAGRGRPCPHQWRAGKGAGTLRQGRWCADDRARSQRACSQGRRIFGAAGRCVLRPRAVRRFAGTPRVTICIDANSAWRRTAWKRLLGRSASLAAAEFLRYANHAKLTRFGVLDDLRRHGSLHQMQIYRLRWSLPGGLLLRGRQHAGHPSRRMHRLRRMRTWMPGRRHQARHRARSGKVAGGEYRIRQDLAEHHPEEGIPARRQGFRGHGRQVREIFFSSARDRRLKGMLVST